MWMYKSLGHQVSTQMWHNRLDYTLVTLDIYIALFDRWSIFKIKPFLEVTLSVKHRITKTSPRDTDIS